jgi:hypothetical protein
MRYAPPFVLSVALPALGDIASPQTAAMKDWELYSWLEAGEWRFSLLLGTNRTKVCTEIKSAVSVKTLAELDAALVELGHTPGQVIIWEAPEAPVINGVCDLAYPPAEIAAAIHRRIKELGIFELH